MSDVEDTKARVLAMLERRAAARVAVPVVASPRKVLRATGKNIRFHPPRETKAMRDAERAAKRAEAAKK